MLNNYQGIINIDRSVKKETQKFLMNILERDPLERYSSEEALEDPIFAELRVIFIMSLQILVLFEHTMSKFFLFSQNFSFEFSFEISKN